MSAEGWAAAGEFLTGAGTIILSACAVIGLGAYVGHLRSKVKFRIAETVIRRSLHVRDAIQKLRAVPLLVDYSSRPGRTPGDEFSIDDYEYAFRNRHRRVEEAFTSLDAIIVEAEYMLEDQRVVDTRDAILHWLWVLHASFRNHTAFVRDSNRGVDVKDRVSQESKDLAVVYDNPTIDGPDEYAKELRKRVDALIFLVKPHLGMRQRWWSLCWSKAAGLF